MGLFGRKKKKEEPPKATNTNSFGEPLGRLTLEGELPWGWIYANREFTEQTENEYRSFSDALIEAKKQGVKEYHAALRSLVMYMEDVKKLCESKGECFAEWATIMVANPATLDKHKEELEYYNQNIGELLKREQKMKTLQADVLKVIVENPGILQTDVLKLFPSDMKPHVKNEIYQLWENQKIERVKEGRTYSLKCT